MRMMKRMALAAALAAVPALAGAQALPSCVSVPNPATRAQMVGDSAAWRSLELAPGTPAEAQFGPKLDALDERMKSGDDKDLEALRQDFHDWKVDVLKASYQNPSKSGKLGADFCSYVNGETRRASTVAAISRALTRQGQVDELTRLRFARFQQSASPFDGAAPRAAAAAPAPGDSSAVVLSATGPEDPARYAKVRQMLISEGASPRIVDAAIREALRQHKDPLLVLAVINAESGFNAHAHSPVGARGLMQIMPGTGQGLGVRDANMLYDVQTNLRAGISYLGSLWNNFADFSMTSLQAVDPFTRHDVKEVVAAYNAGPGAVDKYHGVPPYRETQKYVRNVLAYYEKLKRYLVA